MISFVAFIVERVFLKMVWPSLVYMASEGQMNSLTALGSSVHCQKTRQSGGENPPWPLTRSCWCCWSWTPPCDSPGSSDPCSFRHWGSEGSSQCSCPPADRQPDSEWPSPACRLQAHLNSRQDNQVNSTLQCGSISVKKTSDIQWFLCLLPPPVQPNFLIYIHTTARWDKHFQLGLIKTKQRKSFRSITSTLMYCI